MERTVETVRILPTKRTVKRWGIGLAILLGVLLVVNGILAWRTETRFRRVIAAIRAEGDPASIAELKPAPIPDEHNAAAHIDKLTPRLEEFSREYGRFYKTDLGKTLDDLSVGDRPNAEQIAGMRAILDKYTDLEQMIAAAAACPEYASTADFSLGFNRFLEAQLPRLSRIRDIARMVDWRVKVLVADEQRDEAVQRVFDVLRLARLSESEPSIVSFLISTAVRGVALHDLHYALSAGPVRPETYDEIERTLQELDQPGKFEKALRTERALSVSASLEQAWENTPYLGWLVWPVRRYYIGPLELYDRLLPVADRSYSEIKKLFAPGGQFAAPTDRGVLADLLTPALEAGFVAANRDIAMIRVMRVYNALKQFAVKNGREANGLGDLALPAEATTDPFTGQPLIARHTDAGWAVYSVGSDGVDDGGSFEKAKDFGFGPPLPAEAIEPAPAAR
ncbi:MAG: hypothetical protein DCC67_03325 [Planctomycetota bacterium]|nr:MAG: hypothetical protein DCC67_03325 [Planctomycetota bacterium]